jgi:hypothetical protein
VTATSRLFWIETRRSVGFLAFPILIALAGLVWYLIGRAAGNPSVALWPQTSVDIGFTVVLIGPATAGLAAWAAGRDRRRGLDDLLATTPRPATARDLNLAAATAAWVLLAYLAFGLCAGILTAREATWGSPVAPPILIGAVVIAVEAAIGYTAGSFVRAALPGRLTAGLVPVVLFFFEVLLSQLTGGLVEVGPGRRETGHPYENLSPFGAIQNIGGSVFWTPRWDVVWAAAVWFLGLGGLALALVALRRRRRSPVAWGSLAAAALAIVIGWTQLVPNTSAYLAPPTKAISYDPVCVQRSLPICLHPAYKAVLGDTADLVDPIVRPLAGLPGFPTRAEQPRPAYDTTTSTLGLPSAAAPDTIPIEPTCSRLSRQAQATAIALAAVQLPTDSFRQLTPAQSAIAVWLLHQAGWGPLHDFEIPACLPTGTSALSRPIDPATLLAADRFAAMTPDEQHTWLTTNIAALRAGSLSLEDLP